MDFDNNKYIDEYFKRGLINYSHAPDDSVWENIEWRFAKDKKKVRRLSFVKVAAGLLLFVGLATFLTFESSYFTASEKDLAAIGLAEELKSSTTLKSQPYSGETNNEMRGEQVIAPDVSIPHGLLPNRNLQSQIDEKEEPSRREEKSMLKLTALNTPVNNKKTKHSEFIALTKRNFNTNNHEDRATSEVPQEKNPIENRHQHKNIFSLSGSFSPILSYRNTKMATSEPAMPKEKSLLSYSGGMDIGYTIGKRFTLRTGVHYTKLGQSLNNVEVTSDSYAMDGETTVIKIPSSIGTGQVEISSLIEGEQLDPPDNITHDNSMPPEFTVGSALYQTFEMMKMPVMLEYSLIDNKFNLSMIGGVNANLLVDEGIFTKEAEASQRIGSTKDLNKLTYSGTFGVGLKYDVGEQAKLFMEPSFDYYITSLSADNSFQTFPYYFGFFSGVSISF